jgi:hypothetical protein
MTTKQTYTLVLQSMPLEVPPVIRLRRALKTLRRVHGFEVVSISEVGRSAGAGKKTANGSLLGGTRGSAVSKMPELLQIQGSKCDFHHHQTGATDD